MWSQNVKKSVGPPFIPGETKLDVRAGELIFGEDV